VRGAAEKLASRHEPFEAPARWTRRFADFIAAKARTGTEAQLQPPWTDTTIGSRSAG